MTKEEKKAPLKNSEPKEKVKQKSSKPQAEKISQEEINDLLDRYDGFESLLAPLAEELKRFSPEAGSKKKRFLQDEYLIEERAELKEKLAAYVSFFESNNISSHKDIKTLAQDKLDKNEDLINENLDNILGEVRDLERTYRELELFFRNAAPQKVKNIKLLNVHPEALIDPDSNAVYSVVEKMIMDESRSVDQRKAFSMLVIPDLWKVNAPKMLLKDTQS